MTGRSGEVGVGFDTAVAEAIEKIRQDVSDLHAELPRYELVAWTSGNVSGRVPGEDLFVIKPSGVGYADLAPHNMVVCTLDGHAKNNRKIEQAD